MYVVEMLSGAEDRVANAADALARLKEFKTFLLAPGGNKIDPAAYAVLVQKPLIEGYSAGIILPSAEGKGYLSLSDEYFQTVKLAASYAGETFGVIVPIPADIPLSAKEQNEKWIGSAKDVAEEVDAMIKTLETGKKPTKMKWLWWLLGGLAAAGAAAGGVVLYRRRK